MQRFIILLLMVVLSACQPNTDELHIPKRILSPDMMVDVLVDMQLVEGTLIYKRSLGKKYMLYRDYYYSHIFNKYDITQKKFEDSMSFYKKHLKVLQQIYEKVIKRLEDKQKEIKKEKTA